MLVMEILAYFKSFINMKKVVAATILIFLIYFLLKKLQKFFFIQSELIINMLSASFSDILPNLKVFSVRSQ